YLRLFGAGRLIRRPFLDEEDRLGGARIAVVSYGLWRRRFGADAALVGHSITLNGEPYNVVGILGSNFVANPPADIWLPLQADPNSTNQGHFLLVAGRLKPGVSIDAAKSQMKLVGEQFRR